MSIKSELLKKSLRVFSNCIPDRIRYTFFEQLKKIKKLDYPKEDIYLTIYSAWESARADNSCSEEPETVQWIEDYIKPGDVLYDIGANVGVYSLIAAKYCKGKARVFSFEPSFLTFSSLCENVFLNNCQDSIMPLHIALSDKTIRGKFHYASLIPGDSMHVFGKPLDINKQPHKSVLSLECQSYKLDDLVGVLNFDMPNHIKLDVDGIELEIMQGAKEILKREELKTLLIEVNEIIPEAQAIVDLLSESGFVLSVKHKHKAADETGPFSGIYNYIFTREVG